MIHAVSGSPGYGFSLHRGAVFPPIPPPGRLTGGIVSKYSKNSLESIRIVCYNKCRVCSLSYFIGLTIKYYEVNHYESWT